MSKIFENIAYQFKDVAILRLALTHRSVGANNNERLEFVGDAILGFIIAEELFVKFPKADEGDLSRLRAELVQKNTLAEVARELKLGEELVLGSGELKSGGANRESILADVLEAIICAIYIDGGLDICRKTVLSWFNSRLGALNLTNSQKDSKTRLQELLQAQKAELPRYEVEEISGKDHQQEFSVLCFVALLSKSVQGKGASRREAEQKAAKNALTQLGV